MGRHEADEKLYGLSLPGIRKHDLHRSSRKMWCIPAHEAIYEDLTSDRSYSLKLEEALEDGGLPQSYLDNPVVTAEGDGRPVIPYALFFDGVPYTQTDSVVGFWLVSLLTGWRKLIMTVRKRLACGFGGVSTRQTSGHADRLHTIQFSLCYCCSRRRCSYREIRSHRPLAWILSDPIGYFQIHSE